MFSNLFFIIIISISQYTFEEVWHRAVEGAAGCRAVSIDVGRMVVEMRAGLGPSFPAESGVNSCLQCSILST